MTDIFFSYSSTDRERVRPVRDALAALGFDVFWDQQVPSGTDWDSWIRRNLASAKCALVFWSEASVASKNVRHEATVADAAGKLIPVLLEPLRADQFPMGLYTTQAANLSDWTGESDHAGWRQLNRDIKLKLIPNWVQQQFSELEAELLAERARREGLESRNRALQAQISKEIQTQQTLQQQRDDAINEVAAFKEKLEEMQRARAEDGARAANPVRHPARAETQRASPAESSAGEQAARGDPATLGGNLRRDRTDAGRPVQADEPVSTARGNVRPGFRPLGLVTASIAVPLVALGLFMVVTQQQQTTGNSSNSSSIKIPGTQNSLATNTPTGLDGFDLKQNTEASGVITMRPTGRLSVVECQKLCSQSRGCSAFTYQRGTGRCWGYQEFQLWPNSDYDTGVRR